MSQVIAASPLAEAYQRCSQSFKELHLALFAYGSISLVKFNDEYGRFGVFGGDSEADRTGRGSLDDMIRNDPRTTSIISELLENLEEDLNTCTAILKASPITSEAAEEGRSKSGQAWLSDEDSISSSGSEDAKSRKRFPVSKTQRILHLLAIIVDHIQSLFQISTLLRRPTISNKYLRSLSKASTKDFASPSLPWDYSHIVEKRRCWANEYHRRFATNHEESNEVKEYRDYLCQRLASANARRREQLFFWQENPAQPPALTQPNDPGQRAIPQLTLAQLSSKRSESTQHFPHKSELSKPSQGTKHSFSTVAISDLNDAATHSGRPRTEYAPSIKGESNALKVPPIPKISNGSPNFKCPYCSTTLDTVAMSLRDVWKKHVFRDLRPYICTFEGCSNPEKLYLTRHDWIYHESQMHRRQWTCASCSDQKYFSKFDFEGHMRSKHEDMLQESQLPVMVKICEQPLDDDADADCPLCPMTLPLSNLREHLAYHLEDLALFVLPLTLGDCSQDSDSDRAAGTLGDVISNISHADDGLPELDFEREPGMSAEGQDPATFLALLQSKKEHGKSQLSDWIFQEDGGGSHDAPPTLGSSGNLDLSIPDRQQITQIEGRHFSSSTTQEDETKKPDVELGELIDNFIQTLAEALNLHRLVERLVSNLVDKPGSKSKSTLGGLLLLLIRISYSFHPTEWWKSSDMYRLQQILSSLGVLKVQLKGIIQSVKDNICLPQSQSPGIVPQLWRANADFKVMSNTLQQHLESVQYHISAIIAQNPRGLARDKLIEL